MKLTKNQIDALNIEVSLSIEASDYSDGKKKKLNEFRRNAEIKGFRKGMVPMSLVEKMYGERALVDSVNDVISEQLNSFIADEKLSVIGEPLPAEKQPENEWKDGNSFNFTFDIACNPEVNLPLGKDDEVVYYNITVTEEAKKEMKANLLKQYGALSDGEAAGEDDFIVADLQQEGNTIEGTYIALRNVAEAAKKQFIGVKPGDSFDVNVNEAFENENDRASLIKVKKEELATINPVYKVTVKSVKTFVSAPETPETFDKIYGEGVVKTAEEFDAKIAERLSAEYKSEQDFRFSKDVRAYLLKKADLSLPEAFLKRWIHAANGEKFTVEEIEKEFPLFAEDYKWTLVRDFLMKTYDVKVAHEDLVANAKAYAAYQFAMYGMANVPEEHLTEYANEILKNEDQARRVLEQVENEKTVAAVKDVITLKNKKITVEKFRDLK